MKKNIYLILSIMTFVLSSLSIGIIFLFLLIGKFFCGRFFYIINGANGPIPACTSIINTDFIFVLIVGIVLLILAIIFLIIYKLNGKKSN